MSKLNKLLSTVFAIVFLFVIFSSNTNAQLPRCTSTFSCCTVRTTTCTGGGSFCDPRDLDCTCYTSCTSTSHFDCDYFNGQAAGCVVNPLNSVCIAGTTSGGCGVSGGGGPVCQPDGNCLPSGGCCSSGSFYADATCASGNRCGTASGGGGGGGGNGACGSCNTCGAPQNECALINGVCSKPGYCGTGVPANTQGAQVYCQDPGGPYYPMPGVTVNVGQTQVESPYAGQGSKTRVTNANGQAFFDDLQGFPAVWYSAGVQLPPALTLPTGQTYANLKSPGELYQAVPGGPTLSRNSGIEANRCLGSGWSWTHCGPGWGRECGWFCAPNPSYDLSNPARANRYEFEIPSWGEGAYNMVFHYTNCTPTLSCTVDLVPNAASMTVGSTQSMIANVTVNSSTVTSVAFNSANASIASFSPLTDTITPYGSTLTANSLGSTTVNAVVTMADGTTCTDSTASTINVTAPGPWWQASGGNVTAGGSISSNIPLSYIGAFPYLIKNSAAGHKGLAVYSGTASFGSGSVSTDPKWLSSTAVNAPTYNYNYVTSLLPSDWTIDTNGANINNLNSGTPAPDGYRYHKYSGPATISSVQNINQQSVLFIDGDLTINNNITLNGGSSFLLIAVSGNITVGPNVTRLDGLYLSNGGFSTGTLGSGSADQQLQVNGSVVAYGGFNLQRNLLGGNVSNPGELFTYDPRLILYFPKALQKDFIIWREVNP